MDQEATGSKQERPLGPGEALVFSKQNYEGQEQLVTADTHSLDFPAGSLRMGPKTGVTVFHGEGYQGDSQELTTDLNSFTASRLQGQPKSLKIWPAAGKPFTGLWAIGIKVAEERAEGRYLSAGPDGLLTTNPKVSERERFRFTEGLTGWASARYLAVVPPLPSDENQPLPNQQTGALYRATAKLNVREGPGTDRKAIGYLQSNETAELLEAKADGSWLRIRRKPDAREALLGRRRVTLSLPDIPFTKPIDTLRPGPLFVSDLENLTSVNEPEAGFRKFSLLSQDNRWICYNPQENYFLTSARAEERTIFCQSIKLAEDETQVGALLQGEAALYENPAYWGRAWVFSADYADFDRIPNLNDQVSSIQLGPLTGVTIYRGAQFTAEDQDKGEGKQDVTSNLSSLAQEQVGENQISSMQLWRIVPPGGLGVKFQSCLSQDFRGKDSGFEEYTAYRTTLQLPPTVQTVEVWATDETEIEVDEQKYPVSEDRPVTLKPNLAGCLVITTDAIGNFGGSLRAPGLKIRTDAMEPHERIVIFPDQEAHEKLAAELEKDADGLWNAEYKDEKGLIHNVIEHAKDPKTAEAQRLNAAEAQRMIQKVMSTMKYSKDPSGNMLQTILPPDELQKGWVLYFRTYMVTADTLYVRKGPGREFESTGFLRRNDIVESLESGSDAGWIRVRRLSDGLTGWSSSRYLKTGERYRVTGKRVHLRQGPGTQHPSLGYIESNEIVTCIGVNEDGTWRQIRRGDGLTGWSSVRYFALLPAPPLPPLSGPPPTVKYQEMSQGDVQALLAVAQSPDTDLAQGFFSDIVSAVKKAVSITVSSIKNALTIIVEMVDKAIAWVVDTAEKVIAFVEGIFEKIGAFIKDVIKWLRFMFDWKDILETRDYLRESINKALDYLGGTFVEQTRQAVMSSTGRMKRVMMNGLDNAIGALGGDPDAPGAASTIIAKIKSTGIPDALEWILSKVMSIMRIGAEGLLGAFQAVLEAVGAGDGIESAEQEADGDLLRLWDETLVQGLEGIVAVPVGLADAFVMLARNPDEPLLALARLLNVFRDLLCNLVDLGERAALGLLDSVAYVVKKFREIISARIRIPFISDLIEWINRLPWIKLPSTLPPLLDAFTLILAVPITMISKAVLREAPFKNVPALAQSASGLDIATGLVGYIGGALNGALDAYQSKDTKDPVWVTWAESLCVLCGLLGWALPWQAREDELDEDPNTDPIRSWEKGQFIFEGTMWGLDLMVIVIGLKLAKMNPKMKMKARRLKRASTLTAWAAAGAGVAHLVLLIGKSFQAHDGAGYAVADALTIAPEILSFLPTVKAAEPYGTVILVNSNFVAAGASIAGVL